MNSREKYPQIIGGCYSEKIIDFNIANLLSNEWYKS